jgi:sn-glycerol 3-phosphate transport system ATP-binding protein
VLRGRGAGLTLGVRPEHVRLVDAGGVSADVTSAEYHGADTIITARIGQESMLARVPGQSRLCAGDRVRLGWNADSVHVFDAASGARTDGSQSLPLAA